MIPEYCITEWRQKAPWTKDYQVEQDLIISRVLIEIYQNEKISENLVFRGGTALNKLYITPPARYSEDLDFVQMKSEPIGPTIANIRNILDNWLGAPKGKLTERSAKLIYNYLTIDGNSAKVKIEINTTEHFQVQNLSNMEYSINSAWFEGKSRIVTYQLEELIATKLRALYQRRKGRDLFDLWYISKQNLVNVENVIQIFQQYCNREKQIITRALFEKNLSQKYLHPEFKIDMQTLLAQDAEWNFDDAFDFVNDTIINKIPGKSWKGLESKKHEENLT
jgi:predicted nucleotidyltransferase component of viral defense system